jgi:2-polyprenyl-3-methyl-5-hydroxy-6-metoxy-1,4-benzoquinol methylase
VQTPKPEALAGLVPPSAAHDDLSFEELELTYNYRQTTGWENLFVRLLLNECARHESTRCIDIGCGAGIGGSPELLRPVRIQAAELWGLEPDPTVRVDKSYDFVHRSTMENANLPNDYFNVAFSFMVMEHVENPRRFLTEVYNILSPGGRYLFITINERHYFGRIAKLMLNLRLDEQLVRLVRGGKDVDRYHYPIRYRCNHPSTISRLAKDIGFAAPEYVFVEEDGPIDYFPLPIRPVYHVLQWKRRWRRRPDALLGMIARLEKPAEGYPQRSTLRVPRTSARS